MLPRYVTRPRCIAVAVTSVLLLVFITFQPDLYMVFDGYYPPETDGPIELEPLSYCDTFNVKQGENAKCGKPFKRLWLPYLKKFNLSESQISQMTKADDVRILSKDPVFVTAFSDNHFDDAIKGVVKTFEYLGAKFYVYDLGLNKKNLAAIRSIPSVIAVKKFNFSAYPRYARHLYEYRWKAMLLAEMLQEHEAVFYADAHYHQCTNATLQNLLQKIRCQIDNECNYYSSLFLSDSGHSIFAATLEGFFDYIPMDIEKSKTTEMGHAQVQLIYYTKDVRTNLFKWFVLCALEKYCMAPSFWSYLYCDFKNDRWGRFGGCHRYDQTATAVLLANRLRYDTSRYIVLF